MTISFRKAAAADAEMLREIQHKAFLPLYEKYRDEESPANDPIEEIAGKIDNPFGSFWIIEADGAACGGIYVHRLGESDEVMYLCSVFILPEMQGKGLAQAAIRYAHAQYPETSRWVLDVPESESRNIHIYEKMGYCKTDNVEKINDMLSIATYVRDV